MKHYVVWHPEEELAYRGATATEAKLRARHAQFGKVPKWHQMQAEGWQLSEVERPEPTLAAVAPSVRRKAR